MVATDDGSISVELPEGFNAEIEADPGIGWPRAQRARAGQRHGRHARQAHAPRPRRRRRPHVPAAHQRRDDSPHQVALPTIAPASEHLALSTCTGAIILPSPEDRSRWAQGACPCCWLPRCRYSVSPRWRRNSRRRRTPARSSHPRPNCRRRRSPARGRSTRRERSKISATGAGRSSAMRRCHMRDRRRPAAARRTARDRPDRACRSATAGRAAPPGLLDNDIRRAVRDLLELAQQYTIDVGNDTVTLSDDLQRVTTFATDGRREKHRSGATEYESTTSWNTDNQLVQELSRGKDLKRPADLAAGQRRQGAVRVDQSREADVHAADQRHQARVCEDALAVRHCSSRTTVQRSRSDRPPRPLETRPGARGTCCSVRSAGRPAGSCTTASARAARRSSTPSRTTSSLCMTDERRDDLERAAEAQRQRARHRRRRTPAWRRETDCRRAARARGARCSSRAHSTAAFDEQHDVAAFEVDVFVRRVVGRRLAGDGPVRRPDRRRACRRASVASGSTPAGERRRGQQPIDRARVRRLPTPGPTRTWIGPDRRVACAARARAARRCRARRKTGPRMPP